MEVWREVAHNWPGEMLALVASAGHSADDARHSRERRSGRADVVWNDQFDLFRCAAEYVDKILRGAKPGDFPVEQPTKFELVSNLTAVMALGLTIAESLRADEVIE